MEVLNLNRNNRNASWNPLSAFLKPAGGVCLLRLFSDRKRFGSEMEPLCSSFSFPTRAIPPSFDHFRVMFQHIMFQGIPIFTELRFLLKKQFSDSISAEFLTAAWNIKHRWKRFHSHFGSFHQQLYSRSISPQRNLQKTKLSLVCVNISDEDVGRGKKKLKTEAGFLHQMVRAGLIWINLSHNPTVRPIRVKYLRSILFKSNIIHLINSLNLQIRSVFLLIKWLQTHLFKIWKVFWAPACSSSQVSNWFQTGSGPVWFICEKL